MSDEAFGYTYPVPCDSDYNNLLEYVSSVGAGFFEIEEKSLYNFPEEIAPKDNCLMFIIGDKPGYPNATYLMDCYNFYDPESSSIGFSTNPNERLNLLLDIIENVFLLLKSKKMIIVLTDSGQVDAIKKISISEVRKVIGKDFKIYQGAPDTLYEITLS